MPLNNRGKIKYKLIIDGTNHANLISSGHVKGV